MEPMNRGPEDHGHDAAASRPAEPSRPADDAGTPSRPAGTPSRPAPPPGDPLLPHLDSDAPAPARTARIVSGDHLLTVNPVDGSEIEPCPPGERPARPERRGAEERAELRRAAAAPPPSGTMVPELPMLERDEERERLSRLLARGRSVRVTGPSGAGRSVLLEAVAADCEGLAPDGVVRLSGYHRTPSDLLHDLYAAVYRAPLYRPDRAELLAAVQEIGAVVVLDDIDFGGAALDEFLDATPECAFLISATPEITAPSADSYLEEVFLSGLSRTAGLELLERAVRRSLTEEEASWAADLWFESEGLPLRFVQAGALLRRRDTGGSGPLPSRAEAAAPAALLAGQLGEAARDALRFAVALGGELPHQAHLPALTEDAHADAALGELLGCGLVTTAGSHYRLAAGVVAQLTGEGFAGDAVESAGRAHTVAQHYAWWAGHPSVAPDRVAAEADAILGAMTTLVAGREAGHADAAVLLARAAAPAFAAALHWGAWERAVRHGQEAARLAGQVSDEAYFHHELGVLALCTGNLERARAELEASIGLRGVLADKRGTVAGRRALALVTDRTAGSSMAGAFGTAGGAGRTAAGEEVPAARHEQPASAPGAADPDGEITVVTPRVTATSPLTSLGTAAAAAAAETSVLAAAGAPGSGDSTAKGRSAGAAAPAASSGRGGRPRGLRRLVVPGARRNVIAAAAGALLVAVLGTVVTLGAVSDDNDGPAGRVKPDRTASHQDGDPSLTADEPTSGTDENPRPGPTGVPRTGTSPTGPSSGTPGGSTSPGDPSTSGAPSETGGPSSPSPDPTTHRPTHRPTRTPSSTPTTPDDPTTEPTPSTTPSTTAPTPSGHTSTTAAAPTTPTAASSSLVSA
ncbi:ATP-binding protein [Streptomyces sp. NA02950]|uniref:ATP-binding protein n=1 Tax=Streptomyces sp. NA02950 TaxID=2742137 RepID=UPI0015918609|nr:ATP-binding protein [Streptomyces sp. NA02950]QKV97574.1 ATP-binding protein [Streptomyces sp. NA02950]